MTSTAYGTCRDCDRPRKPGAIFCQCGALLDYSAPGGEHRAAGQTNGEADGQTNGEVVATTPPGDLEWPPGPYEATPEPNGTAAPSLRVVHCPNDKCKALNPTKLLFCWKCGTPMAQGEEATLPWSLRRALRLEKPPLRAGERARPHKSFISEDPLTLLRAGLVVLGVLLLVSALVIGAIKAWGPSQHRVARWYGVSREAVFPRFKPVHPSSVNPPRTKDPLHPAAAAFDRNLSTFWQSTTKRRVWDRIRVNFKPPAQHIDEVAVFAGDPTAATIVPRTLQMTFYTWQPHPSLDPTECRSQPDPPHFPRRVPAEAGAFCVTGIARQFALLNTPAEQRFSTGHQVSIGQIVITIRGVHRTDNPKAKAALTDVEFFDKH